jgi:hypothetical protein
MQTEDCQQLLSPLTTSQDLVYEPTSFKLGAFASLAALMLLAALGSMRRRVA